MDEQRRCNLQAIVNNGRFLILPWVNVKGLASKILALSARQMPREWETRYGCRSPAAGNRSRRQIGGIVPSTVTLS